MLRRFSLKRCPAPFVALIYIYVCFFVCCDKCNYMRRLNVLTRQIICVYVPIHLRMGKKGDKKGKKCTYTSTSRSRGSTRSHWALSMKEGQGQSLYSHG